MGSSSCFQSLPGWELPANMVSTPARTAPGKWLKRPGATEHSVPALLCHGSLRSSCCGFCCCNRRQPGPREMEKGACPKRSHRPQSEGDPPGQDGWPVRDLQVPKPLPPSRAPTGPSPTAPLSAQPRSLARTEPLPKRPASAFRYLRILPSRGLEFYPSNRIF